MPPLADERREKFCQLVAKGTNAHKAALQSGYTKASAKESFRLKRREEVVRRLSELTAEAASTERFALARAKERYAVSTERIVGELARIGFADMGDYIKVDAQGNVRFNLANMKRDQSSVIQEIIVDEYVDGRGKAARQVKRTRIKLYDKQTALISLGKHLGLFVDPSVLNVNVSNYFSETPPSMDEWRKEIEGDAVEVKRLDKKAS